MPRRQIKTVFCAVPFPAVIILLVISFAFAEKLPFKSYTTSEGLAHDRVNRIVRDLCGFLCYTRLGVAQSASPCNI